MPKKYEAIKTRLERHGLGRKAAEKEAAKIYNSQRKKGQRPVTRGSK